MFVFPIFLVREGKESYFHSFYGVHLEFKECFHNFLGSVHTPDKFEKAALSLWLGLTKTELFENVRLECLH